MIKLKSSTPRKRKIVQSKEYFQLKQPEEEKEKDHNDSDDSDDSDDDDDDDDDSDDSSESEESEDENTDGDDVPLEFRLFQEFQDQKQKTRFHLLTKQQLIQQQQKIYGL